VSKVVLQYSIVNDTAADAAPVEANFTRIESHINQELIEREGSVAMTGQLKLAGNPVAAEDAASKGYVDSLFIIGSMQLYGGSTDPAGGTWLLCDGRELESASYPSLFSVIGTSYGSGGAGRFNIPDMRGRVPLGASGLDALGASGGVRDQPVPTHTHTINHNHGTTASAAEAADHFHSFNVNTGTVSSDHFHYPGYGNLYRQTGLPPDNVTTFGIRIGDGIQINMELINSSAVPTGGITSNHSHNAAGNTGGRSAAHSHNVTVNDFVGSTGATGVAVANGNLPPYRAVNYLIKVR
jgi:microcystin-dependent protein